MYWPFQNEGGKPMTPLDVANSRDHDIPVLYPLPRRRRVDRNMVAFLLSVGWSVGEVAEKVGCSRQHVWRLMRRSKRFGRAVAAAEYEVWTEADGRLTALRPVVASALVRELAQSNVRVMLWLADRLGLASGGYATLHPADRAPQRKTDVA
jgi:hypothetical protein